jgi:uncharacterized coiled-coil protein SlyX
VNYKKKKKKTFSEQQIENLEKTAERQSDTIDKLNRMLTKQSEIVQETLAYVSKLEKELYPIKYRRKFYSETHKESDYDYNSY